MLKQDVILVVSICFGLHHIGDKMKKIIILTIVLSVTLLFACAPSPKENDMVEFESGTYFNKEWSETVGTYTEAVVPDEKTALEIAKVIFNGMDKSKEVQKYTPQSIFYDEQDKIWIVSFWENTNKYTLGGDCSIAIQKVDGKILRIWFGE